MLECKWINEDFRSVRFPDTKTGKQTRIIGAATAEIIKWQQKRHRSEYVFPADYSKGAFIGLPRGLGRVLKLAQIEGVTLHTLKHTYARVAAELGFSELTIAGILGHASRDVTQRYVHIDEALVMAANEVSAHIQQLLHLHVS